jgi:DNA-binding NarL/FixJ family response regulator
MISASEIFQWRPVSDAARKPAPPPSGTEPIPVADSSAPESANRASAPGRLWTILCIEDDPECSSLIGEELKERGFSVVVAHDGEEGLSLLLNSSVDLVLSDINMPGMSGFEVLEKFKELAPDSPIPFIFLTGLSDREDEIAGRMLGADDYVRKPVDFEILQTIIAARLRGVAPLLAGSTSNALSDREREALTWAARGKTREEIGHIMNITKRTVEFHLDNAQIKLGVKTRIEAAVRATIQGLIDP